MISFLFFLNKIKKPIIHSLRSINFSILTRDTNAHRLPVGRISIEKKSVCTLSFAVRKKTQYCATVKTVGNPQLRTKPTSIGTTFLRSNEAAKQYNFH